MGAWTHNAITCYKSIIKKKLKENMEQAKKNHEMDTC